MRIMIKKWGNSASVRIPAALMEAAHLELDQSVDVHEEQGRIVIEPIYRKDFTLDELLDGVTPENLHEPADFGTGRSAGQGQGSDWIKIEQGAEPRLGGHART